MAAADYGGGHEAARAVQLVYCRGLTSLAAASRIVVLKAARVTTHPRIDNLRKSHKYWAKANDAIIFSMFRVKNGKLSEHWDAFGVPAAPPSSSPVPNSPAPK